MSTSIRFTKATGAGNDFVLVDAMRGDAVADPGGLARAACDRHFGVGADGLILLEPSARADFRMRYFNADGSTGGMCGNGGRCAARMAHALGIAGSSVRFEALEHLYSAVVDEHWVRLRMKPATGLRRGIRIAAAGRSFEATFIDTGSPHAVLFAEDLDSTDVPMFGRIIRHDPAFAPAGTNVNFVTVHGPDSVALRTYERGVEAETLACGTGSVAAAIVASVVHGVRPPVKVHVRSGETLSVDFRREGNTIDPVELTGSAELLFEGEFRYDGEHARIRR